MRTKSRTRSASSAAGMLRFGMRLRAIRKLNSLHATTSRLQQCLPLTTTVNVDVSRYVWSLLGLDQQTPSPESSPPTSTRFH